MKPERLLKEFQIDDLARAACHDSGILAWEQGLGKSLAAFLLPILKDANRTLIIAPESLHLALTQTAAYFFKIALRPLRDVEHFYRLRLDRPHSGAPVFYVASYTDVGLNGGDEWSPTFGHKGEHFDSDVLIRRRKRFCAENGIHWRSEYSDGIGHTERGITCIFAPTLARVIAMHDTFDCVIVDEGTKLQATESRVAHSIRLLDPAYRYVLTGTPIKNRLESIFWLASWAGSRYGRWPYASTDDARERFANTFLMQERFLTREAEAREQGGRVYNTTKRSNNICAVHQLWKTLAPIVIRRRKIDCGEDIQPKIVKPIIVPPGSAQLAVYRHHLNNPPIFGRNSARRLHRREQLGVQLTMLRLAALHPTSQSLLRAITGVTGGTPRSWTEFTPKFAAALSVVQDCVARGQQVLIGSPFTEFSASLYARLQEAGISSICLDSSLPAKVRGEYADAFKKGRYAVCIAGLKAMGEGHSFENCSNVIVPGYAYGYDENEQFMHRVWRINSPFPITIYPIITQGTIDERLHDIYHEKRNAADLALDGRLFSENSVEVDLETLLTQAIAAFNPDAVTVDEQDIIDQWESNLPKIRKLEAVFRKKQPTSSKTIVLATPADVALAKKAYKIPSPTNFTVNTLRKHYKDGTYRKVTPASIAARHAEFKKRRRK